MPIYQQFLAITSSQPAESVNEAAGEMIRQLVQSVRSNRSTRIDGDLVFETTPAQYTLPLSVSSEKAKTKWEKFAEEKGIQKKRKSRMVFSERFGKWVPRYGSRSEQNLILQGGVVEVQQSMSKMLNEKRARAAKNKKSMEANRRAK